MPTTIASLHFGRPWERPKPLLQLQECRVAMVTWVHVQHDDASSCPNANIQAIRPLVLVPGDERLLIAGREVRPPLNPWNLAAGVQGEHRDSTLPIQNRVFELVTSWRHDCSPS